MGYFPPIFLECGIQCLFWGCSSSYFVVVVGIPLLDHGFCEGCERERVEMIDDATRRKVKKSKVTLDLCLALCADDLVNGKYIPLALFTC